MTNQNCHLEYRNDTINVASITEGAIGKSNGGRARKNIVCEVAWILYLISVPKVVRGIGKNYENVSAEDAFGPGTARARGQAHG